MPERPEGVHPDAPGAGGPPDSDIGAGISADRPAGGSIPEVVESRLVYRGKVVDLRVDEVSLGEGRVATREVVEHPGAVVIVALSDRGEVFLVRQYRHPVKRYLLELPAGGVEPGEDPLATARRELREEVGLDAERWTALGHFYSSPGFSSEILYAFLAETLRGAHSEPDEDEDLTVVRRGLADLYAHPEQLEDGKSLAALELLRRSAALGAGRPGVG